RRGFARSGSMRGPGFQRSRSRRLLGGALRFPPKAMGGIDAENAHLAGEELQFLRCALERRIVGMAVDVRQKLRRREFALDHVAFELRHVDAVGREAAERLVECGGYVADAKHER